LNEVLTLMAFGSELSKSPALPARASLIDELAKTFITLSHLQPRRRKPMPKHRFGNADHSSSLLVAEAQHLAKHESCLFLRFERT
jgi:hypothetical protein